MNRLTSLVSAAGFTVFLFALYGTTESGWAPAVTARQRGRIRGAFFVLFGAVSVIFHLNTAVGVNLDIRASIVAVSLLFGGVRVGMLVAFVEAITRYYWEGDGWVVPELRILADFACTLMALQVTEKNRSGTARIAIMGLAVGLADSLSLLFIQPFSTGMETLLAYGPVLFSFNLLATLLFGELLRQQDIRLASSQSLVEMNKKLRTQFDQTIESLGSAMLYRDPTTANHQRRVADFSVAIAKEMGLDENQQECLKTSALLHDIGQIEIPAEILNRGRQLSMEEFGLIKAHPETGRDILKNIDFACEVPEIVCQHHENFDGSGYPAGLRGEEILLGARIIRVADSLEAMLSHRPFRQARDVPYALSELESGSGSRYDPDVVQACKRLVMMRKIDPWNRAA